MDKELKNFCRKCEHIQVCSDENFVCPNGVKEQILSECYTCHYAKTCSATIWSRFGCREKIEKYTNDVLPNLSKSALECAIELTQQSCPFLHIDLDDFEKAYEIIFAAYPKQKETKGSRLSAKEVAYNDYMKQKSRNTIADDGICVKCKKNCGHYSLELNELIHRMLLEKVIIK